MQKKIIIISITLIALLAIATGIIATFKPQMHKTFMLESIIYKRSK